MGRGREPGGKGEEREGKTDEGELLEINYNKLLEYFLQYITFY